METIINLIVALFAFWFGGDMMQQPGSVIDSATTTSATVVRVIDGDTIVVEIGGRDETIRYIGIDTPEPYHDGIPACFSQQATAKNTELVAGKRVQLISDNENRDKYERLLRYVYVDGVFVNQQLVAKGYATVLRIEPNTAQAQALQAAEDRAREQDLGLWGACGEPATAPSTEAAASMPTDPVAIDVATLPNGQQKVLNTLGFDEANITITPEVIACAEAAVGTDRVTALLNGDTPGILEGVKLAKCYRAN